MSEPSPYIEDDEEWVQEPEPEELPRRPRRPRRRLLTPVSVALLAMLVTACGFIAGVLVEKGQATSTALPAGAGRAGLAARLGGLRGGSSSGGAGGGSSGFAGSGAGGATVGQVAFIQGATLYVTNTQGNTVKVKTSPGSTVTKTVKASVKSIHPGETVIVTGTPGANGAISAESIRVGGSASGGGGGGEPSLFGRGG